MPVTLILWLLFCLNVSDSQLHPRELPKLPTLVNKGAAEPNHIDLEQVRVELEIRKKSVSDLPNVGVAKNIILFIGDGMDLNTVAAARAFKDQKQGGDGAGAEMSWEWFHNTGLSKTYCADYLVPDSAAAATALYTGEKVPFFTLGYNSSVMMRNPETMMEENELMTILDWAQEAGKKTGIVTTSRITDATPAALYAKSVYRHWEGDRDIEKSIEREEITEVQRQKYKVTDIARQMVDREGGRNIDILLGGGRAYFEDCIAVTHKPRFPFGENETDLLATCRNDTNLITEWRNIPNSRRQFITNGSQLNTIDHNMTNVLGLFTWSDVLWNDVTNDTNEKPSLTQMATAAVKFLKARSAKTAEDKGFFIMIEGANIDRAHHNGEAVRALEETLALDRAVQAVQELVSVNDTLMIVTADHSHTMRTGGYVPLGVDITGGVSGIDDNNQAEFTILSYGNGPGFMKMSTKERGNYTEIVRDQVIGPGVNEAGSLTYKQASAAPLEYSTHGADDVGVWAAGPWSHLVHGTHQQTDLAMVMKYAGCLNTYMDREGCPGISGGHSKTEGALTLWVILVAMYSLV